jgi:hypothetical protein
LPTQTYKNKGWKGYGDFLGTGIIATSLRQYRSFKEARKYVHTLKLKSQREWKAYCKSGKKPDDIPAFPFSTYANKGWKGYAHFVGYVGSVRHSGRRKSRKYMTFKDARKYVRSLKLNSWRAYCKSGKKPNNIPATPRISYKDSGWKGFEDFLGKK